MTFGHSAFAAIFYPPNLSPTSPKTNQRGSKRVPIGHPFGWFWSSRWKCENDGFVQAKNSLSWLEEVPRHLLCSTLRTVFSNVLLGATFSHDFVDLDSKGVPREAPQRIHKPFFQLFFPPCLLWGPLGRPGSLQHSEDRQNGLQK